MTNTNAPFSCYLESNSLNVVVKKYTKGRVMDYVYETCPLFALCIQKVGLEDWFDSQMFQSTVFIPCEEYSRFHIQEFSEIGIDDARRIVLGSTISGLVKREDLENSEIIPTLSSSNVLQCLFREHKFTINNCSMMKADIELENGIVHVLSGIPIL